MTNMSFSDKSPLIQSDGNSKSPPISNSTTVTIIRPKQPRRYKLLPRDKLHIPGCNSNTIYSSEYTKHMPLINIGPNEEDENEIFDEAMFKKVSNKGLYDLIQRDRKSYVYHGSKPSLSSHNNNEEEEEDEWDDWDLSLSNPSKKQQRICWCCQFGCTIF